MGEWIHSWHPGVSISPKTQSLVWHILLHFLDDLGLTELVEQEGGGGEEQRWEGPCSVFIGGRLKAVDCDAAVDQRRSIAMLPLQYCVAVDSIEQMVPGLRHRIFHLPPAAAQSPLSSSSRSSARSPTCKKTLCTGLLLFGQSYD